MAQAVCPPVPSEAELRHSGNYVRINPLDVVLREFLVMEYSGVISCIEITYLHRQDRTNIVTQFTVRSTEGGHYTMTIDYFNNNGGMLYRRNPRKDFDNTAKTMRVRMRGYPENKQLTTRETILANEGLSDHIGQFLGPPTSGKGGRRKRRLTRRTRKNKRKSTRRIRRKYKK